MGMQIRIVPFSTWNRDRKGNVVKMKVLMVGPDRSVHGGISSVVNNYYEADLDKEIELRYIGTMVDGSKIRKLLKAMESYIKFIICVGNYDIVHVNMASDSSYYRKIYFIRIAKFFHKKVVIHQHGGDFATFYYKENSVKQRKQIRKNLNMSDKFLVLTQEWKNFFSDIVEGNKLTVLPNAVTLPMQYEKDYNNREILFLGRLCKDKGIRELFNCVDKLKGKYPDIHLYLGGIWEDKELQDMLQTRETYVTWLGWVDGKQKEELLKKCSIYVLPSYYEGMPVSVLEGMAYGCVSVVSYVGGIKDIIDDGIDGFFIQPKDDASLQKGLERAFDSDIERSMIGQRARNKVKEKYEIHKNVQQLLFIYGQIMTKG